MSGIFRDLDDTEIVEFKQWARVNYVPGDEIKMFWHPVVVAECQLINSEKAVRSISAIAREIEQTWSNVNYAARPYLDAMKRLHSINDMYGCDTGKSVVAYFLSNARAYRGDDARRIKAELKGMLK